MIKTKLKNEWVNTGRFSLYDNTTERFFIVIFKDLTIKDTSKYYCAVDISGSRDVYIDVDLTIRDDACCVKPHKVSAFEGKTVNTSCKIPQESKDKPKFFCKDFGVQGCKYKLSTQMDQSRVSDNKITLHDNREEGVLVVSINSFSSSDAGSYWCGVDMGQYEALITNVTLTLRESGVNILLSVSVTVILIIIIIITIIITVLICRCRSRKAQMSESAGATSLGDPDSGIQFPSSDKDYEEIKDICQAPPTDTVYTLAQLPTSPCDDPSYANIQSPAGPPDSVAYATVSFHRGPNGSDTQSAAVAMDTDGTCVVQGLSVKGYTGGRAVIRCEYQPQDVRREKYFCKANGKWSCGEEQIRTGLQDQWESRGRLSIFDETGGRFFTIVFRELTPKDSGKYYCAVNRPGFEKRSRVDLVVKDDCCMDPLNITSYDGETVNISCRYPVAEKLTSKFFCRSSNSTPDCKYSLATSVNQAMVQDKKLQLHDDRAKRVLAVSLNNFSTDDVGSYWCGVKRNMHNILFTNVHLALTDWCCEQHLNVTEFSEGDTATISCPYPWGYEDEEKFFCRGEHHDHCLDLIAVNTTGVWVENGRFSCKDYITTRRVMVKIRDLRAEDSGIYWCGFDRRWRPANYTKVFLSVGPDLVIPVSVSVSVVILIAVIVVVISIWRCRFTSNKNKEQNMTTTMTLTYTDSNRQVMNAEVTYDEVTDISQQGRPSAADLHLSTVYTAIHFPPHLSHSPTYANTQYIGQQPGDASICDATNASDCHLYDSVPGPDTSADSFTNASCVFTDSTNTSSATLNVFLGDNACNYASLKHPHSSE
ncbi:hypothetical protein ACEWY4_017394 [Coilia grayii]|uniref:Ig-like domain-containing protein n=1 Tax=Coilia grayii TaxID=363190 RepID=A0ABD1JI63_9TELE